MSNPEPKEIPTLSEPASRRPAEVYVMNETHVVVKDVEISFARMVELLVKFALALIPAALIVTIAVYVAVLLLGMLAKSV